MTVKKFPYISWRRKSLGQLSNNKSLSLLLLSSHNYFMYTHKFNKWPFYSTAQQIIPKRESSSLRLSPSSNISFPVAALFLLSPCTESSSFSSTRTSKFSCFIKVPLKILWIHFKSGEIKPQNTRRRKKINWRKVLQAFSLPLLEWI
jgi:hypothetical protein